MARPADGRRRRTASAYASPALGCSCLGAVSRYHHLVYPALVNVYLPFMEVYGDPA